jgi:hypothetical protein
MNLRSSIFVAMLVFGSALSHSFAAPVAPPKGGAAILLKKPVWLTGVRPDSGDSAPAQYAAEFPARATSEHMKVVNAGFWLANQDKPSELFYEFTLQRIKPFSKRLYTRVLLENPSDRNSPVKYEHHWDPAEKSSKVTHGALLNVKRGERYTLTYELFTDESRTMLFERLTQVIVSPLDNTSGCVNLQQDVMLEEFPALKSSKVPIEMVMLACDR